MISNRVIVRMAGKAVAVLLWFLLVVPVMIHTAFKVLGDMHPGCSHESLLSALTCTGATVLIPVLFASAISAAILLLLLKAMDGLCNIGAVKYTSLMAAGEVRARQRVAEDVREALRRRPDYQNLKVLRERLSSERLGDDADVKELRMMVDQRISDVREQERSALVAEVRSDVLDAWPELNTQYDLHKDASEELSDIERNRRQE
jgi:hypothetical protein